MSEADQFDAQMQQMQQNDNTAYIARMQGYDPYLMTQFLDASKMLEKLKYLLLGYEYDDDEDEYVPAKIVIGYNDKGQEVKALEGPLMDPQDVRVTITYLETFLNPNTFLSQISDERINDIMWDINVKLGLFFYNLRHKLSSTTRDMMWGMIEYPILLGLSRANHKITLDAVAKTQHSVEHISGNPNHNQHRKHEKEFKVFGW